MRPLRFIGPVVAAAGITALTALAQTTQMQILVPIPVITGSMTPSGLVVGQDVQYNATPRRRR